MTASFSGNHTLQHNLFVALLRAADWSIADGLLTLTGDLGTVAVLREVDTNAAVGVWRLSELDGKPPASDISVDLSAEGQIYGYAGCFIFGNYIVAGDQLTVSIDPPNEPRPPPELICDEVSDEELQLLSLLRDGRGTANGSELRFNNDAGLVAVFHPA